MWADNYEQEPHDLHQLATHPHPAEGLGVLHCASRSDAALIKRSMVNGDHYEIRPCNCPEAKP